MRNGKQRRLHLFRTPKFQSPAIPPGPGFTNSGTSYLFASLEIISLGVDVTIRIRLLSLCALSDMMHASRYGLSPYAGITKVCSFSTLR